MDWTLFATLAVPWVFVLVYSAHYYVFRRPRAMSALRMAPFTHFMDCLTDGATAGYDRPLLRLFDPRLLETSVERGVVRAMVRCLSARFGPVVAVARDAVLLRGDGANVNFVGLVDFAKVRGVTCRVSWTWREGNLKIHTSAGPVRAFYVTGFRVEPKEEDTFDVLQFIHLDDFTPFAERFVENVFKQPPTDAVKCMLPALQERYVNDLSRLEKSVQNVVRVCGGLDAHSHDVDATLTSQKILYNNNENNNDNVKDKDKKNEDKERNSKEKSSDVVESRVRGIQMQFVVKGAQRAMDVTVEIVFAGLRCFVSRYEVRAQPDTRTQILLDHDTGEKTIIS